MIDLVIPSGNSNLVSHIKESTKIPVLGHAGTINLIFKPWPKPINRSYWQSLFCFADITCHVYIDKSASLDMARRLILDAKIDYPTPCNQMVTNHQ